jgi:hypothetical protein
MRYSVDALTCQSEEALKAREIYRKLQGRKARYHSLLPAYILKKEH